MNFEIWDAATHEKLRFYTEKQSFIDTSMKQAQKELEAPGRQWKRITEISMNPGVVKEKLQPSKVYAGDASNGATICALTSVINHDIKFSTDFIGQALCPHNVNILILMSISER